MPREDPVGCWNPSGNGFASVACGETKLSVVTGMLVVFGVRHPPVIDEEVPLDRGRQALAIVAAIIFALCFTPAPIQELFTR